jgi:hypothetical protein
VCSKDPTVRSLRSDSRAFSARAAAKAAASIASDGGGAVLTAERPGLFDIVVFFLPFSLPAAVPPPLSPVHQAPSPAAGAWPCGLDDDSASVVVTGGGGAGGVECG